jgi:hypothetical protein
MLSLVESEQASLQELEKQNLMNKIIAAGLNSLVGHINNPSSPERALLDSFVNQSFDRILPCWNMLDDRVKFFVFKSHILDFESYMHQKLESKNV